MLDGVSITPSSTKCALDAQAVDNTADMRDNAGAFDGFEGCVHLMGLKWFRQREEVDADDSAM